MSSRSQIHCAVFLLLLTPACLDSNSKSQTPESLREIGLSLSDIAGLSQQLQIGANETWVSFDLDPLNASYWNPVSLFQTSIFLDQPPGFVFDYAIQVKNYENEVVLGPSGQAWLYTQPAEIESLLEGDCPAGILEGGSELPTLGSKVTLYCMSQDIEQTQTRELFGEMRLGLFPLSQALRIVGENQMTGLRLSNQSRIDVYSSLCLRYQLGSEFPEGTMSQSLIDVVTEQPYLRIDYDFSASSSVTFSISKEDNSIPSVTGELDLSTGLVHLNP